MRNHGDEVARIMMLHIMEGEEPPVLREDFKQVNCRLDFGKNMWPDIMISETSLLNLSGSGWLA